MKILFDNYSRDNSLIPFWGFSLFIKKHNLLLDTGSNGRVLLSNIHKMNLDVSSIKHLFVSHDHWDHIGGVDSILELNSEITLYVPASLSKHLIKDLKTLTKKVIVCGPKPTLLFDNIYSTGILGDEMPEQAIIINDDYPKVITGCAHFGIENIVEVSSKIIDKKIKMAIGGFHLFNKNKSEILSTVTKLKACGVESVLPTHCTGTIGYEIFKQKFGTNCLEGGVGTDINL